jgi:hypothetical protein
MSSKANLKTFWFWFYGLMNFPLKLYFTVLFSFLFLSPIASSASLPYHFLQSPNENSKGLEPENPNQKAALDILTPGRTFPLPCLSSGISWK